MKTTLFRILAVWPAAIWLVLFALAPLLLALVVSFLTRNESSFVSIDFSLYGYRTIFSPAFLSVLWNSITLAAGATVLCLLTGYPFAYGLAKSGRLKNLLLLLVIIPFWTNSLIRTYALVFLLKGRGLLSQTLLFLGFIDQPLSILYTDTAVFAGMVYTLLPFMILPIYASIDKFDWRLVEAAHDLGASRVRAFVSVTWPLTLPGVAAGCMMVFLPALGMFYIPDLLGGGRNPVVGNFIKNQFLTARDWPAGAAASVVLTGLMLLMVAYYRWSSTRSGRSRGQGEEVAA
ncbi:MAG: ABC transporter permease subunit [Proteobacteria bacterium]|nr:ABC transporter permease subunit [Pseudomonadota bacterium]